MKRVYFTEDESTSDAINNALTKALGIVADSDDIKTIVMLFPSISTAESVMSGVMPQSAIKKRSFHLDNPPCGILIESLKSYSICVSHILIPVFISEKELMRFEDEWEAKYWIVIPSNYTLMQKWLAAHCALSLKTGLSLDSYYTLDERVVNGIEWLWGTSFPNEGFAHPLDMNRLKCMANALASNNVPLEYYSVLNYCITHDINHLGGRLIADYFVKAKTRKFKTDGNYNLAFMTKMMNTKHKRI